MVGRNKADIGSNSSAIYWEVMRAQNEKKTESVSVRTEVIDVIDYLVLKNWLV